MFSKLSPECILIKWQEEEEKKRKQARKVELDNVVSEGVRSFYK